MCAVHTVHYFFEKREEILHNDAFRFLKKEKRKRSEINEKDFYTQMCIRKICISTRLYVYLLVGFVARKQKLVNDVPHSIKLNFKILLLLSVV